MKGVISCDDPMLPNPAGTTVPMCPDAMSRLASGNAPMGTLEMDGHVRMLGRSALLRRISGLPVMPCVLMLGRNGKRHLLVGEYDTLRAEQDFTMLAWLQALECDAHAMLSITSTMGRRQDDALDVQREFILVSGCARSDSHGNGDLGVLHMASMTEVPRVRPLVPMEGTPIVLDSAAMEATVRNGPSLHSIPSSPPDGWKRADARRRLQAAGKRISKGKPPFLDSLYEKIGW